MNIKIFALQMQQLLLFFIYFELKLSSVGY